MFLILLINRYYFNKIFNARKLEKAFEYENFSLAAGLGEDYLVNELFDFVIL